MRHGIHLAAVRAFTCLIMLLAQIPPAFSQDDIPEIRRGYVDSRFGQLHYYSVTHEDLQTTRTPIVFFHQTARSGIEYKPLLLEMGKDRTVFAIDTPGYGNSDAADVVPDMTDLAGTMADALDNLGFGEKGRGKVDVFGFHTGAFIAPELAVLRPDLVRRVVLSGVAYMTPEERQARLADIPHNPKIKEDGTQVVSAWFATVHRRHPSISLERAAEVFAASITALPTYYSAYNAVWSYPVEKRFARLKQPVLLLQPHEMLLENTRNVKRDLLPKATLIEMPSIERNVLETGAIEYAKHLRAWLDKDL